MRTEIIKLNNVYKLICKGENIKPVKMVNLKSKSYIQYINNMPIKINISMNGCCGLFYTLTHEITHQILILKKGYGGHNIEFKKLHEKIQLKYNNLDTFIF